MSDFRPGDRVRVTAKAPDSGSVKSTVDVHGSYFGKAAVDLGNATVELVERADDPSKDPVGTVRRSPEKGIWAKAAGGAGWRWFGGYDGQGVELTDEQVSGWEVIGVVPGTPAAEAELERARTGAGSAAGIYNWDEIYERQAPLSPEETEARARHLLHLYDTLTLELSYKWGEEKKERFIRKVEERHPYREALP